MVGILVHRMFQGRGGEADAETLGRVQALVTPAERAAFPNIDTAVERAADIWSRLRSRSDVASLLAAETVLSEVPFSLVVHDGNEDVIVRGTIDALAIGDAGDVTVIEFKTGRRQPVHERQLAIYVQAAERLFPGRRIHGRLIYQD